MQTKTSYIVIVNGKKYYKKTLEDANKLYLKKKDIYQCEIICINKVSTHKQLTLFEMGD